MTNTISQSLTTFITQQKDCKGHGNTETHSSSTLNCSHPGYDHLALICITHNQSTIICMWTLHASMDEIRITQWYRDKICLIWQYKKFSILKAHTKLSLFIQLCFYFYQSLHLKLHACKRTSEWQIAHVLSITCTTHTHTLTHTGTHTITHVHTCTTDPLLPVRILVICSMPKTNTTQKNLFQIRFNQTLILA